MIVDTTFVIDILENNQDALNKSHELLQRGETQLVSSITIFELYSGIARSTKPEQEKLKVIQGLANQIILPFTEKDSEKGGKIHGDLYKKGNVIGSHDCMIAGIALTKGEKILTRNVKHFSRIEGLDVETY